jgi:basic membrane lipoprotein Med (substrate-binding protein (PBP1-ABC) superfamily)
MIKSLLKLLVILVLGILIYNYFLGTDQEKQGAKKIFGEMKDVGVAVKDLLKSEKEKFDAGKYDKAVDKIGNVLDGLKRNAKDFDEKYLDRIDELEAKRKEISRALQDYEQESEHIGQGSDEFMPKGGQDTSKIKQELEKLLRETESLIEDMESNK